MPVLYRKKLNVHTYILPELNLNGYKFQRLERDDGFLIGDKAEIVIEEFKDFPLSTRKPWVSVLFGEEDVLMLGDQTLKFDEAGVELFERHLEQCRKNGYSAPERIGGDWLGAICWIANHDSYYVFNIIRSDGYRKMSLWIRETDVDEFLTAVKEGLEVYRRLQKERLAKE